MPLRRKGAGGGPPDRAGAERTGSAVDGKRAADRKSEKKSGLPHGSPSMGEEKPDEELMGKRKSSPRFAASLDAAVYMMSRTGENIHAGQKIFIRGGNPRRFRFPCAGVILWYD